MARKLKKDNNYFEVIDSEYKAYVLGFIFADGTIYDGRTTDRPNRQLRLTINCVESDSYVFDKFLEDNNDASKMISIRKNRPNEQPISVIRITSNKLCNDLIALGNRINKTYNGIAFPSLREDLVRHFIRGFLDGDGSIMVNTSKYTYQRKSNYNLTKEPNLIKYRLRVAFINTDIEFLKTIESLLPITNATYTSKGMCNTLWIESIDNVRKTISYLYDDATIYLKRKRDKVDEYDRTISSQASDKSEEGSETTCAV